MHIMYIISYCIIQIRICNYAVNYFLILILSSIDANKNEISKHWILSLASLYKLKTNIIKQFQFVILKGLAALKPLWNSCCMLLCDYTSAGFYI